jgi:hypothetical protein
MTLKCTWVKDQTGDLVMKWTGDEVPVLKPGTRKPANEYEESRRTRLSGRKIT